MSEVKALIAYLENEEIEEVLWTFTDVEQAREHFDKNIKSPKDFYSSPDSDNRQVMALFVLYKSATLTWSVDEKLEMQTSDETQDSEA